MKVKLFHRQLLRRACAIHLVFLVSNLPQSLFFVVVVVVAVVVWGDVGEGCTCVKLLMV